MKFDIGTIGTGTGTLGNLYSAIDDAQAFDTLATAWDEGIRYFDTAPHYGLGLAERRLGEFLRTRPRDEYVVSTKVGRLLRPNPRFSGGRDDDGFDVPDDLIRVFDPTKSGIRRSLEESLERMGLDSVDIVYLHDPEVYDEDRGLGEGLPALTALRDEGMVGAVGLGTNSAETVVRALNEGDLDVIMMSGRFTLLEQPALQEVLPLALDRNVPVIAVSIFNSGVLASENPSSDSYYDYTAVTETVLRRAQRLAAVSREFGVDLPRAAIHFPLRHPAIHAILFGASTPAEVSLNMRRFRDPVPEALWERLVFEGLIPTQTEMARTLNTAADASNGTVSPTQHQLAGDNS